jgi:hypothetical protein
MAKAWVYQRPEQVRDLGEELARHYVDWIDPEGKRRSKSCGPGAQGQCNAEKLRQKR